MSSQQPPVIKKNQNLIVGVFVPGEHNQSQHNRGDLPEEQQRPRETDPQAAGAETRRPGARVRGDADPQSEFPRVDGEDVAEEIKGCGGAGIPGTAAGREQFGGAVECPGVGGTGALGYHGARGVRHGAGTAEVAQRERRSAGAGVHADTLRRAFQGEDCCGFRGRRGIFA